jgi:hypothetical protein
MRQKECEQSRCTAGVTVGKLALITLVVLTAVCLFPAAQAKDKPEDYTMVVLHTYDEVFQAAQTAVERKGWIVTGTDKDKGVITAKNPDGKCVIELHVEIISQKPETRVTMNIIKNYGFWKKPLGGWDASVWQMVSSEMQKVLATYQ